MKNEKVSGEIYKYALPCIAERLLITLVSMASSVFMGRLGANELVSVSLAATIIEIVQSLMIGLGVGATVYVSAKHATGKAEDICKATFMCLIVGFVFSAFFFILFFSGSDAIVNLLFSGSEHQVKTMTANYLQAIKWALPFLILDIGITACLRGIKNSVLPFIFTLCVNVINIVLCIVFIFGMNLGYLGGAYAYNISVMFGGIAKFVLILLPVTGIQLKRLYRIDFQVVKRIIKIGFPTMLEQFFIKTGFLGMQVVTSLLGTLTLAGYQIFNKLFNALYSVTSGLEMTIITYVSEYRALGEKEKATRTVKSIVRNAEAVMLILGIAVFVVAPQITGVFTSDIEVSRSAVNIIRIMVVTLPFTTYFQTVQGTLKICKDVKTVIVMNAVCTWILRVPIAFVLVKYLSFDFYGLLFGFLSDYIIRSLVFGHFVHKKNWLYDS